jgi:hypothetical protein
MRVDDVPVESSTLSLSSLLLLHGPDDFVTDVDRNLIGGVVKYENGIDESRYPMVIAPVSLIFFSVPVSSSALVGPPESAAASARPIIRRRFIRFSSLRWLLQCLHHFGRM